MNNLIKNLFGILPERQSEPLSPYIINNRCYSVLPCPFCGEDPQIMEGEDATEHTWWHMQCPCFGETRKYLSLEDLIRHWNRRAGFYNHFRDVTEMVKKEVSDGR